MRKMSDCNLLFDLNIGEERTLVVDLESEDAVLIGRCERSTVNSAILSFGDGL